MLMTIRLLSFLTAGFFVLFAPCRGVLLAEEKAAPQIVGVWQGTLDVGAVKLRLVVEFTKDGEQLGGQMDSPDQGAFGMPIDEVTQENQSVKFTMKNIGGAYEGELSADGKEIKGKWSQGSLSLPLTLVPGEKVRPPQRPQEPKKPYPYDVEEVTYENQKDAIKLAGTLTLPRSKGPHPAVLLITGSGPQNRNEELLGHKPFLVLADYLTRRGIAVLRVDDRGVGGSGGKAGNSTSADHVEDALAGVAYLKSRGDIHPQHIGLIGHSEGGLIAPAVAVRSSDVAFIVMLAGTGLTGEEILYLQGELIAKAAGAAPVAIAANRALQQKLFAVVKEEQDDSKASTRMEALLKELKENLSEEERKTTEQFEKVVEAQMKQVRSPWFRYFLTYDPKPVLEKVKCPVLAINGELDLQVPPKNNLPAIEAALQAGGNADVTVKELPGLNHLFQACKTGSPSEYGQIEETINPAALELVGNWIVARTPAKADGGR